MSDNSEQFGAYEGHDGSDSHRRLALSYAVQEALTPEQIKAAQILERAAVEMSMPKLFFPFQGYGYISQGFKSGHPAIDFPYPDGTLVYAAHDGEVVAAGKATGGFAGYAYHVKIVNEELGIATLYAHLRKDGVLVKVGQKVKAKELIGKGDSTGNSTGPHLHFELLKRPYRSYTSDAIDPTPYLVRWELDEEEPGDNPTPTPGDTVTATAGVNVRIGPSVTAKAIGTAPAGTTLEVIGREGDWVKVAVYVHGDYVK